MKKIKWTYESCQSEALKYNTLAEYSEKANVSYCKGLKMGWNNDICSHMKKLGNWKKKCIYAYEFSDNHVYIGLTYNIEKRNEWRKLKKDDAVTIHIEKTKLKPNILQLTEYISVDDAIILECTYIDDYKLNNWNLLNRIKGGSIGGKLKWTHEKCKTEALKYNTKTEFKVGNDSAYKSAKRNGWFDEITKHMINKTTRWTFDIIKNEALNYKTRYEFNQKNLAAYTWALRHSILNEVCLHMKKIK